MALDDLPPPPQDPLDQWERSVLGKTAQLRFPLRDPADLRRLGKIMRELGVALEALGQPRRETPFSILSRAKFEIKAAQGRLASRPRGKPASTRSAGE